MMKFKKLKNKFGETGLGGIKILLRLALDVH